MRQLGIRGLPGPKKRTVNHVNAATEEARSSASYWLVGSDGGIFSFGSAGFHGSTGSLELQRPVVGITPTANEGGSWLVASDGGSSASVMRTSLRPSPDSGSPQQDRARRMG